MASGFLILISFFTRIPVGKKIEFNEDNFVKSLQLFTLLGAVIGFVLYAINILSYNIYIPFIKGLILTIAYIILTGGIHLDGAADTADGLFSGRTGNKIFDIMSDSHIGTFGVITLILIVLSQFVMFSYLRAEFIFMMPVIGKASTVVACWNKKYAKNTKGMGTSFVENINDRVLIVNLLTLFVLALIMNYRIIILTACFVSITFSYFISTLIEDKIGGMTGDTCGFITEISQIIFMLSALFLQG